MKLDDTHTLVQLFFDRLRELKDQPLLWERKGSLFRHQTWKETSEQVNAYARALMALGVKATDRVALACPGGETNFVAEMGTMCIGAVTIAVPEDWNGAELIRLLQDTKAKAVILSSPALAGEVASHHASLPDLLALVSVEYVSAGDGEGPKRLTWQELLSFGRTSPDRTLEAIRAVKPADSVTLLYRKTAGGSFSVKLRTHIDMVRECSEVLEQIKPAGIGQGEVIMSAAPFAHPIGHAVAAWLPMILGGQHYYVSSVIDEARGIESARPTMMIATAPNFRMLRQLVTQRINDESKVDAYLLARLMEIGKQDYEKPGTLSLLQKLLRKALPTLITRKIHALFGGRLKLLYSVDNDVDYESFLFFHSLGIPLLEMQPVE